MAAFLNGLHSDYLDGMFPMPLDYQLYGSSRPFSPASRHRPVIRFRLPLAQGFQLAVLELHLLWQSDEVSLSDDFTGMIYEHWKAAQRARRAMED
ncbi:hypothetical protein EAO75_36290 [Streptomyces sp. uw30]|nr:hypothetical protein EAO75_36290 [Streptomyces sp. uw30]